MYVGSQGVYLISGSRVSVQAMATLAALSFLHERTADRREEWELLAAKARARLHDLLAGLGSVETVQEIIESSLAAFQRALAASQAEAEQDEASVLTRATSMIADLQTQLEQLGDLLKKLPFLSSSSPSSSSAPERRRLPSACVPRIEEVD
jgi:hypothetical protein